MNKNLDLILKLSLMQSNLVKKMDTSLSVHGISFSEFIVMYQISLSPNNTVRRVDLAQSVGMSASGITRMLNPMERLKLIEKEPNPRDARVSLVKLTDIGDELLDDATKSVIYLLDEIFEAFKAKDIEMFLHLIKSIK